MSPSTSSALRNYIGGVWRQSGAAEEVPVINPATGEELGRAPLSGAADVGEAVRAAEQAYPAWRRTPVTDRVQFLFKLKPLLERHFEEADLLVLPGTGGLAVQHAMAHALPVIVAKGDGTQDDLVRASNGWQIPSDDLAALAAAMRNALSDLPRLRQMGSESLRIVAEEINIDKMVETFLRALR